MSCMTMWIACVTVQCKLATHTDHLTFTHTWRILDIWECSAAVVLAKGPHGSTASTAVPRPPKPTQSATIAPKERATVQSAVGATKSRFVHSREHAGCHYIAMHRGCQLWLPALLCGTCLLARSPCVLTRAGSPGVFACLACCVCCM